MTREEREADLDASARILARRIIDEALAEAGRNPLLAEWHLKAQAEICRRAAVVLDKAAMGAANRIREVSKAA